MTAPALYLHYLAAAARPAPLSLVVLFGIGLSLATTAGLLGVPLALLLLSWTSKYGFVCFDAISRGQSEPPVLSIEMVNPADEQRPLGTLLIVGVFYAATSVLAKYVPDVMVHALRLAALALLPASVLTLAVTGSIVDAVNPRLLVEVTRKMGVDYLGLAGTIFGLYFLVVLLIHQQLWLAVTIAASLLALLALFCLMGGLVYERREALGFDAWNSPERKAAQHDAQALRAFDKELDDIYAHTRTGAIDEAWTALSRLIETRQHEFEVYRQYYLRLARWPDSRLRDRLAKEFIARHGVRAEKIIALQARPQGATRG